MMEEDSVTQDNKLLTEELYEIIVDKNDAQVECLEDVQMQCQEDAQIRYHDPLTNPPADLPQEMSTSLLFMTPKKGSADTQNLGNFSKNPSTPAKIGSNSLKSPKAPTMTVGTKRKLVEKEPTKMKLQNFFTVIKKDEKKLCHKNLIDCTGNDSSEMNGNMNASFDEYFPSFYLKPTAKLAPIFNKLHYKRHESEVGKFSTLTRTSDSCKSMSENCWRQRCKRMQESMLIHLKKIQEIDGEETINVPYKLLQFHDNYRPAYFGRI